MTEQYANPQATVNPGVQSFDVVILGGTPGGMAAATAAVRLGRRTALVEHHDHLGGMTASGLGKSDIENRSLIGGLFAEFIARVRRHYHDRYGLASVEMQQCQDGYYAEPAVAGAALEQMLRSRGPQDDRPHASAKEGEPLVVLTGHRLQSALTIDARLSQITIVNRRSGETRTLAAPVFIDATYEGDLYAAAGAEFRLGRESREEYGEPHAGVVYFDYQQRQFLPGTTGEADDRLPAYTYRLCLATDVRNAAPLTRPPENYDRRPYLGYFDDLAAGRLGGPKQFKPGRGYHPAHFNTLVRALSVTELPGGKTDVNINPRPLGFPFPEENRDYVSGDDAARTRIAQRHRELTLGLLWFLQQDAQIPLEQRELARQYHLPRDEFTDNDHFPFQLYVREARRLAGEYTLTEHDITSGGQAGSSSHADRIAVGEFPIDSFPCRKRQAGDRVVLEGYLGMLDYITRPYEIPYRIMIPQRIEGLIVPVAASTTHVAYSSIRMEPTWMALGQAAGVAAHLSILHQQPPRSVPLQELQELLRQQGQVLEHAPGGNVGSD
ncbi:FAD-dependent oxidoreductase [Lignipirellula cremea]|uniref:Dihydrolipoamide dehydrogenase n=1 Tax=Lignipirellula cremea TaxID=2528010 RepID=A0A518E1K4_9BACT|nr:FAD-dependent oxidoreductase [Lignipirellula cremea]QDU97970.1 dihydrolipoamide dehydrogenase [Lignipirellula cremea]